MSEEISLMPELRFPEFKNKDEWKRETVGDLYEFKVTNSFSRESLNYQKGYVKNIHYGDVHTKFSTHFDIEIEKVPYLNEEIAVNKIKKDSYCIEGDIVFADASEDLNDIGKSIEIVNLNNEKLVSGLHTLLARQRENKLSIGFGGYLFKSPSVRKQIQREAQGAKVLGISATRISNIKISYPKTPEEQQKIASCLSSLDAVIAAHREQLELLKDHKKGLMQNLFPQEGDVVPKYRFPEFQNDGKWVEKKVKDVFTIFQGFAFSSEDNVPNGTRWLKIADVGIQEMKNDSPTYLPKSYRDNFKKFLVKKGDYVLALTRPILNMKLKIAPVDDVFHNALLNQRVGKIITTYDSGFVYYQLQTESMVSNINRNIAGNEPPNLSFQQIENILISIPENPKEQYKVSSCLSSLDNFINIQVEKIDKLQLHKEGLMQRLFPKVIK